MFDLNAVKRYVLIPSKCFTLILSKDICLNTIKINICHITIKRDSIYLSVITIKNYGTYLLLSKGST